MDIDSFVAHLIARGISSDLANRIEAHFADWKAIGDASPKLLAERFTSADIEQIERAKNRRKIPRETVIRLIDECEFKCCLCWDIDSDLGVVIHHIRPHAQVPDDRYENLVILCSEHHDKVHTKRELTRDPFPPELLIRKKTDFITAVSAFREGKRCAPGSERNLGFGEFPVLPNVPAHFEGRSDEVENIYREISTCSGRAAIVGMGGVGKSALGFAVADKCRDSFPGGILWVEASKSIGDISLLFRDWIRSLGGDPENVERDQLVPLTSQLLSNWTNSRGKLLLLFDDIIIRDLKTLTSFFTLLSPQISILLTSRDSTVATAVGATQFDIAPLNSASCVRVLENVSGFEYFRGYGATQRLLKLLGNLPLAIELIARQISIRKNKPGFSIEQLCDRLEKFDTQLLSFPGHRGIAMSFALSFDGIEQYEKSVFRSLGIFAQGPIYVRPVSAVLNIPDEDVEESLDRLVGVSMLSWGETVGEYRIHSLLKKYAGHLSEQLPSNELRQMHLQFYKYYTLTVQGITEKTIADLKKIEAIFPNLKKAIQIADVFCDQETATNTIMHLCVRLQFFTSRNYDKESIPLIKAVQCVATRVHDKELESVATGHLATAHCRLGEIQKAKQLYKRAIKVAKDAKSNYDLASHLQNLALTMLSEASEIPEAENLLQESLVVAEKSQNMEAATACLGTLALIYKEQGSLRAAADLHTKAIACSQVLKDRVSEGTNKSNLGLVLIELGQADEAERLIQEAIEIARETGNRRGEGNRIGHMGGIILAKSIQLDSGIEAKIGVQCAKEKIETALGIARETGDLERAGAWLMNLGNIHVVQGNDRLACEVLQDAVDLGVEAGFGRLEAQSYGWHV